MEVKKILKNLCHSIRSQFGLDVQGFRTDNAKDFCNNDMREFLENEGIRHETSCPYTPQQNGIAERKIGDIMDKGRTLMEQSSIPKNLWGYAVMTAMHLIYRLPTKSLNLKSPTESLEKLFPSVRLRNGLEPKVFGCVGHVHVCNLSLDKLLNKALRYVFVGY